MNRPVHIWSCTAATAFQPILSKITECRATGINNSPTATSAEIPKQLPNSFKKSSLLCCLIEHFRITELTANHNNGTNIHRNPIMEKSRSPLLKKGIQYDTIRCIMTNGNNNTAFIHEEVDSGWLIVDRKRRGSDGDAISFHQPSTPNHQLFLSRGLSQRPRRSVRKFAMMIKVP